MKLTFLKASVPLTKSFKQHADGTIEKTSYPNIWEVTSIDETATDLAGMEKLLNKHAALNHCLLKGTVQRPLMSESRAGSTDKNAATDWLCLDLDGIPIQSGAVTIASIMADLGLKDVSHIIQWSGSMGIGSTDLRCHVFVRLLKPVSAPLIKQWLIQKNHEVPVLRNVQKLTKTANAITWGLDITACQSDKLIYIAPPTLIGIKNPLGKTPRISLVRKAQEQYDLTTAKIHSTAQNRSITDARVLELRETAGLPKRKLTYKTVGAFEVLAKPDECIATEIKHDRGFVYFNLNGGDSWAYYHPEDRPDFIFNFKGEPAYLTKELLPTYWEQLKSNAYRTSSSGVTYLAFLDRATSTYWRGTYDAAQDVLDILPAKTETMVRHFAEANGLPLGDFIPEWSMEFNPHVTSRVDLVNRTINTFQPSLYMKLKPIKVTKAPSTILKVIHHVLGGDQEATDHYINWLAFIAQKRERTMTAWVFQGTQGTGKGLLMNKVLMPLFGEEQTVIKRAAELTEKWTDFLAGKFIIFIDEVQTSAYRDEHSIIANMKNFITEPTVTVRGMHKNSYPVPNYGNWQLASNKPDPVNIDKEDRRFNVGAYQSQKLQLTLKELDTMINGTELIEFWHYLTHYPVDEVKAYTPLQSKARDHLINLSQTTSESAASAINEGSMGFFFDQLPAHDADFRSDFKLIAKVNAYKDTLRAVMLRSKNGSGAVRRDELFAIFDYAVGGMNSSPTTFTRFLGHRQINIKPISVDGKTERGIIVHWTDEAKFPQYLADMAPPAPKTIAKAVIAKAAKSAAKQS